jgi:hypothetical protein
LYDTRHLSLIASTFFSLFPACHTRISCLTPRLCFGSSVRPDCGSNCNS